MILYHNNRCRKSRETLELVRSKGVEPEIVEYLKTPLNEKQLSNLVNKLGIKAAQLIRKGETIYKEKYKGQSMDEKDWIKAMAENPILMERPILEKGDEAVVGRPPENVMKLI